ncbi:MAG: hypothetical protein DRJ50_05090 [Actinobacteria bacterium]|nr:MAG: hypothetical protein DRJ50_05090 [Actinomycetota bacterium]
MRRPKRLRPGGPEAASLPSSDSGQASVEFALSLPIVVVMALALLAVGIAVRNEIAVELAAREGARAAAVSASGPSAATTAAQRSIALPIDVSTTDNGSIVTVTVTYTDPVDIAIIGRFIGPITHSASASMSIEPP